VDVTADQLRLAIEQGDVPALRRALTANPDLANQTIT
jgi:hypothetical protein